MYTRDTGECGIYDDAGLPIQNSDIVSVSFTSSYAKEPIFDVVAKTIEEPCLFAGIALPQFGHVLTSALGRLWALEEIDSNTTIVFTVKHFGTAASKHAFVTPVIRTLGIQNSIQILTHPTRFQSIYTAPDEFGERYGARGSDFFYAWLDRRLPKPESSGKNTKLFVSREGIGARSGRFACEDHLAKLLKEHGCEVYCPEKQSFADQLRRYQTAERLIFSEGSALHAFALCRQPGQQIAVIQRRELLPELIAQQMNDRKGAPVLEVNAIKSVYWPPIRGDHYGVSLLDFESLGTQLLAGGFISSLAGWTSPSPSVEAASLIAGLKPGERMYDAEDRKRYLRNLRRQRRTRAAKDN